MSYFGSIYADQELSHRARTVYMYLKDRSNVGDTCWRDTAFWNALIAAVPTAA